MNSVSALTGVAGGSSAGMSGPLEINLCQKMIISLSFLDIQPADPICTNNNKTPLQKTQTKNHHPTPKNTKPEQNQSNKKPTKNLTQQNQNKKSREKRSPPFLT